MDAHLRSVPFPFFFLQLPLTTTHYPLLHTDHRSPPPPSRIPDPSDILATALISSSTIQPESYQPMPTYRLVPSDGACPLSDDAMREVCQEAEQVAKSEWDEVGGEGQS